MGVQREPGQKGVSWSNIAVGKLDPSSDATFTEQLLNPHSRIGGIMNMVISFLIAQTAFTKRYTRFSAVQYPVCEHRLGVLSSSRY